MSPLRNGKIRNLKRVPRTRAQPPPSNIEIGDVPISVTTPNAAHQPHRATGVRYETETSSRCWLHGLVGRQRTPVRHLKEKIVCGHATREEVAQHPHRIVFTEYKIGKAGQTSGYTHQPKRHRQDRLFGRAGSPHLNEPAGREQKHTRVADYLPTGDLNLCIARVSWCRPTFIGQSSHFTFVFVPDDTGTW